MPPDDVLVAVETVVKNMQMGHATDEWEEIGEWPQRTRALSGDCHSSVCGVELRKGRRARHQVGAVESSASRSHTTKAKLAVTYHSAKTLENGGSDRYGLIDHPPNISRVVRQRRQTISNHQVASTTRSRKARWVGVLKMLNDHGHHRSRFYSSPSHHSTNLEPLWVLRW